MSTFLFVFKLNDCFRSSVKQNGVKVIISFCKLSNSHREPLVSLFLHKDKTRP